jgi:hypothetical protein
VTTTHGSGGSSVTTSGTGTTSGSG